jgi:hypothetical protein
MEVGIDMQKLIKVLVVTDLLLANSVYADGINVKAAYGDALEFVAIKFLIAAILFYLFTYDLIGKVRDTPLKSARWIGGILLAIGVGASNNKFSTLPDYIYGVSLVAIGLYVIGFAIGYIWKPWAIKGQSEDNHNYLKACLPLCFGVIVIIGLVVSDGSGMSTNTAKYDAYYSCKETGADCSKPALTFTFKVDKEKSQVIAIYSAVKDESVGMDKLENCTVVDEHNWQCKGDVTAYSTPRTWTMIEDKVTMSDSTFTISGETTTYYGLFFVKR